ncbi:hypothetical protein THIOSC15_1810004 [uncultured Thiomicrorhabdus sp.]
MKVIGAGNAVVNEQHGNLGNAEIPTSDRLYSSGTWCNGIHVLCGSARQHCRHPPFTE